MKSILFIHRKSPHGSMATREGVDAVLATAAFGVPLALLFLDDGVFQLCAGQTPEAARLKPTAPLFESLEMYEVDQIYVCRNSLAKRGLQSTDLVIPVQLLEPAQIPPLLTGFDHLLTY